MVRKILIALIGFTFVLGCAPKIDQKKYEDLNRAAKAIQGATVVGVSYQKFGELLQNLSTEISIANDKTKSDIEKELLKAYIDVLTMYHESATIWKHNIKSAKYDWIPSGQIPIERELQPIISKYSLLTDLQIDPISGSNIYTISENAIQLIWGKANEHLEKATQLYLGQ